MNTPCIPNIGIPRERFTVPSIGSMAHVLSAASASGDDSSDIIASSGNSERIAPITLRSISASTSVTES